MFEIFTYVDNRTKFIVDSNQLKTIDVNFKDDEKNECTFSNRSTCIT